MNWIIIGYIINVVINYILIRRIVRSERDCPGCAYELCDRHYGWTNVFLNVVFSIFGPLTLITYISMYIIFLLRNSKPPKWL